MDSHWGLAARSIQKTTLFAMASTQRMVKVASMPSKPSQWRRLTDYPKRKVLLADATIDPFPHRVTRSASLLEHHIVRDSQEPLQVSDDDRRASVSLVPFHPPPASGIDIPRASGAVYEYNHPTHGLSSKPNYLNMTDQASRSSSPASVGQTEGQTQFCLCQPEPKIPRPRNAFILYRQHQQAAVIRTHPGLPNPAISKIIGEQWSHLPESEKDKWKALAEEEKARHAQQYPEYRYQPRRNGRYSSASSGPGLPSGGKVDQNGNCIKCGGKTMNPPTTPYTVQPHTPTVAMKRPHSLTYSQGHRPNQPVLVSPLRSGVYPHGERMWVQTHAQQDSRYDHRPRYMAEQAEGPDLKRRRFDAGYVSSREPYREVPSPYPYSPRDGYPHKLHHDMHQPRSAMVPVPPSHLVYPQQPPQPPKLQSIRPPPPPQQHKPKHSLTLPPLSSTGTQTPSPYSSTAQGQGSGLEAMIMSIPVLNKIKILSQISPHLVAPGAASPQPEFRGAIVAVEGPDPDSLWSMTSSLADQLSREGKFAVKVFHGPDPFTGLRTEGKGTRKELAIADCLNIIREWHKISEDMKNFITTRPVIEIEDDAPDVSSNGMEQRQSVVLTDAASSNVAEDSQQKTATRDRRPARLDLNPPDKTNTASDEHVTPPTSGTSAISPKTVIANKAAGLSISTPPSAKCFKNPWSRGPGDWENPGSPPYTRIPNIKAMGLGSSPARDATARKDVEMQDSRTAEGAIANDNDKGKDKEKDAHVHFSRRTNTTPTPHLPSLATPPIHRCASDALIPIALVPHYQLSTVDASAIAMPIIDSYTPLAHWQWLATLWRGCVGPDVSVVIKHTGTGTGEAGSLSMAAGAGITSAGDGSPNKADQTGSQAATGAPRARTDSVQLQAANPASAAGTSAAGGNAAPSSAAPSASAEPASGVEVRLFDYRAVVVRTNVLRSHSSSSGNGGSGCDSAETTPLGCLTAATPAEEKKRKEELEFWEKAKRRVGFEVAEFVRR